MLLADKDEEGEPVILLDRVRRGGFEFRGIDEQGRLGDWSRDWKDSSRTPMMVRLKLEFERGTDMRWPVLEVPLLIDIGGVNNAYRFFGPSDEGELPGQMGTQLLQPGLQPPPAPQKGTDDVRR
jgi:general secretion pathway protein J